MSENDNANTDETQDAPARRRPRRLEDMTEEERQRMERFIWQPEDLIIIKHPRNLVNPPPVPVRRVRRTEEVVEDTTEE